MKKFLHLIILFLLITLHAESMEKYDGQITNVPRQVYLINENWQYLEDNCATLKDLSATRIEWQPIDLPHTWNAFDATDMTPGYRRDISWYKKVLHMPKIKIRCSIYPSKV